MIIGPASAMILALGCITVFGPIVMSPFKILSSHTKAPADIFRLHKELTFMSSFECKLIEIYSRRNLKQSTV